MGRCGPAGTTEQENIWNGPRIHIKTAYLESCKNKRNKTRNAGMNRCYWRNRSFYLRWFWAAPLYSFYFSGRVHRIHTNKIPWLETLYCGSMAWVTRVQPMNPSKLSSLLLSLNSPNGPSLLLLTTLLLVTVSTYLYISISTIVDFFTWVLVCFSYFSFGDLRNCKWSSHKWSGKSSKSVVFVPWCKIICLTPTAFLSENYLVCWICRSDYLMAQLS